MDNQDYGQLIKDCGIIINGGTQYSVLNYVSGIEKFDEFLNGKTFSETDYKHSMAWFEKAVVFYIFKSGEQISASFPKNELIEVVEHKNVKIDIFDVSFFTKLKDGKVPGGLIGGAIFKVGGVIGEKINDKLNNKTSKKVDGSIFEFIFKNENSGEYVIKLSCENDNLNTAKLFMIYKDISQPIDESSTNACYIATVCYGDNMSHEVVKYREFRDLILKNNYLGKKIIKFYYNNSEEFSKKLEGKKVINFLIKYLILNPIYLIIKYYMKIKKV